MADLLEEEEGEPWGQSLPPFSQHLRENILQKYPDSGQILKELIQNADDAGATEVSFLLDHTDYHTCGVPCRVAGLQQYQGPALYAFNNGVFTEQDWQGIKDTEQGAKRKDPLRIGRFGVGFNSVYHITDMPSVMSGNYILILDPLNTAFPEGGRRFKIAGWMRRYAEFLPFLDKLGNKIYHYPQTLFRFPLRTAPSDLSDTIYTPARMRERYSELIADSDCLLLFLKNVEKVTFKERYGIHGEKVALITIDKEHDKPRWARFLEDVSLGKRDVESCEPVIIRTKNAQGEEATSEWLVKTKVYDLPDRVEQQLCSRLEVIPWVGVAMRAHEPPKGRVFCFLPLPSDPENSTGLPVHVHGYFGLSDNRRSVTWESSDQRDDTTEWNKLLLTRLIPEAYAELLEAATVHFKESRTALPSLVYDSWPDQLQMTTRWEDLLSQFAANVVKLSVFHTKASDGQWLHLSEICTNDIDNKGIKYAVDEILLGAGVDVATLPVHVKATVVTEPDDEPKSVSPDLVRKTLKRIPDMQLNTTRLNKLHLLEYTMSDSSYKDMVGLPLLPLKSNEFTCFTRANAGPVVYLSSERHPASLLPCLNHRLVDDDIGPELSKHLVTLAQTRVTQVRELTPSDVVRLLPSALPQQWLQGSPRQILWQTEKVAQPPKKWLSTTWEWIIQEFPDSLEQFESLPLLPANTPSLQSRDVTLFPLRKFGAMMKEGGSSKQLGICDIMEKVGVNLVDSAVPTVIPHKCLMSRYIVQPTPAGVLSVLNGREKLVGALLTRDEKVRLRRFLSKMEDEDLTAERRIVLSNLPILERQKTTGPSAPTEFTSAKCTSVAMPNDDFPKDVRIPLKRWLLSSRDSSSVNIHRLLKLQSLTLAKLLIEDVLPVTPDLPPTNVQKLMTWVLDRLPSLQLQASGIVDHIKSIAFVTLYGGEVAKPLELFDPTRSELQDLFAGENVFPTGEYRTEPRFSRLKQLGLKTKPAINDVLKSARLVSDMEPRIAIKKAKMVFKYVMNKPRSLRFTEGDQQLLKRYEWMPCRRQRPEGYSPELGWFGKNVVTARPQDVADKTMINLVGSTMPILDGDASEDFKSTFDWPKPPPIDKVAQHLKSVIHTYVNSTPGSGLGALSDMIIQIYQYFADTQVSREQLQNEFSRLGLTNWVWHGSDFTSPERVAVRSDMTFDLSPYLFVLPPQLISDEGLRNFFLQMGVSETFGNEHVVKVLQDIQGDGKGSMSQSELDLCIKIINFLTKNCTQECTAEGLLVPTQDDDGQTRLAPPKDCMYCDSDWLREKGPEYKEVKSFRMLHQSISPTMANLLGIPSMTHKIVQPKALGPGMKLFGQKEPITRRLKTIIDEYKEGSGIFYELIQNADDAGATEVRFAVDWRQNSQARKSLLSDGMADCQGPALWAYNNKVFTDEDIQNITEISGATKKKDTNKIGRFGLGFNSVYHITDVPSFISRNYFVCFDPHTTHLSPLVNHSEPGIQIDLSRDEVRSTYSDQFKPFDGIFDCDIFTSDRYPATLFRFPFRTEQEAQRSEISSTMYDRERLFQLLTHFAQSLDTLLLFTEHVRSVTVMEIDEEGRHKDLMHVKSTVKPLIESLPLNYQQTKDQPPGLLQITSSYMKDQQKRCLQEIPSRLNDVSMEVFDSRIAIEPVTGISTSWMISSCIGSAESLKMAQTQEGRENGLLPCASVAACLQTGTALPTRIEGKAFCFLPLPECTGLPIHVNAPFAILSSRQGICKSSGSGMTQPIELEWNKCLLRDAIPSAYLTLLQHHALVKGNSVSHISDPFGIWPNKANMQDPLFRENLVPCFYKKVLKSPSKILLSLKKNRICMKEASFLHPSVRESPVGSEALQILSIWMDHVQEQAPVVDLPRWVYEGFRTCNDPEKTVEKRAFSLDTLLSGVFCPAVKKGYLSDHRSILDKFVLYLLDEVFAEHSAERQISYTALRELSCVPSSPQGNVLRCPCELVDPKGTVAKLFDDDDQRFPYGEELRKLKRMESLRQLGMMVNTLPWNLIFERATSCEKLYQGKDHRKALVRMSFLYTFIMGKPALNKNKASMTSFARIAVQHLLMVADNPPTDQDSLPALQTFCHAVYALLQSTTCKTITQDGKRREQCVISDDDVKNNLTDRPFVYITKDGNFVRPRELAFKNQGRAMKMLKVVPVELQKYSTFLRSCGVREYFEATDFVDALKNIADKYGGQPLDAVDLQDSLALAHNLEKEHGRLGIKMSLRSRVFLPDQKGILRTIPELTYDDAPWRRKDPSTHDYLFVHHDIPPKQAVIFFGVETVRSKLVDQTAEDFGDIGEEFGQGEELTDRIKGILESYSTPIDIFKELLQNADDAGATEVKFIHDKRRHSEEKIFSTEWNHLQGPALLVYNNKTFSQSDIKAIQKIGKGNKQETDVAIGKFGVGFNAVYHITDCPSFITDSQRMCIFDPHTRYIPGATMRRPGRLVPMEALEDSFPDVLKTFVVPNQEAPLKGSTLFRLPLRSEGMPSSNITDDTFQSTDIDSMMESFWKKANQAILFLNNIEKVSFATIEGNDPNQQKQERYTKHYVVRKVLSEATKAKRGALAQHIKWQSSQSQRTDRTHGMLSITPKQETYQLDIEETDDEEVSVNKWLISERVGFDKPPDLHTEELSFARLKYFVPRVAVASLLDETRLDRSQPPIVEGKAFCYLPLPTKTTCLPVHVNGHFALDSSRRNLSSSGLHGKWNELLKTQLLAQAYFDLLVAAKEELLSPTSSTKGFDQIEQYCSLFPVVNEKAEAVSFNALAAEVYRIIASRDGTLLPVVVNDEQPIVHFKRPSECLFEDERDDVDDAECPGHTQSRSAKVVLLAIGCNIVETEYMKNVYTNFQHARSPVEKFSPSSVVEWLRAQDLYDLKDTCLTKVASCLQELLKYCLYPVREESQDLDSCLHDVPLLLAQDKKLYRFNKDEHAFVSKYHALVSAKYSYRFAHETLVDLLFSLLQQDQAGKVIKRFDMQDMALLAKCHPDIFPSECLIPATGHCSWHPEKATTQPTTEWIKLLWKFLLDSTKNKQDLRPIENWQIIPSKRPSLFSLANAKMTFTRETDKVLGILKKLQCPFVNEDLLGEGLSIIHKSLASPTSSKDVITVLEGVMKEGHSLEGILNEQECSDLLIHLQRDIGDIRGSEIDILKSLPVFQTLDGVHISLCGVKEVLVLDKCWTEEGAKQWRPAFSTDVSGEDDDDDGGGDDDVLDINALLKHTGRVVLSRNEALLALYKAVGVTTVSHVILYVQYILPSFNLLKTSEECIPYITYIKDDLLPSLPIASSERKQLLQKLRSTAFIPHIDGKLVTSDQFYNPNVSLFSVAKDHVDFIQFPPSPFWEKTWIDFLVEVGLKTTMDPNRYLQCVKTVEEQSCGKRSPESTNIEHLARELVTYLFKHVNDLESVLEEVSESYFLPCHPAPQHLTEIHPSVDKGTICFRGSVTSDQQSLVWTTSLVLPQWASPRTDKLKNLLGVQNRPSLDDVIANCVNVCSEVEDVDVDHNVLSVMERIYHFFQKSCTSASHCFEDKLLLPGEGCGNCQQISRKLIHVPCVIVEAGSNHRFSVGAKVVFEMSHEDRQVFDGYLFHLFRPLGQYEALFRCQGVTESVTLGKYALVLSEFVNRYGSVTPLDENTSPWKAACAAVGRIVDLSCGANGPKEWQDFRSQTSHPVLYLPTELKTLVPSQDIVIIESKDYDRSSVESHKKVLTPLLRLSREAVESIPEDLRPVFLSDITEEEFSENSTPCKDGQECPFLAFFTKTFLDETFARSLALATSDRGKFTNKSELIPKIHARLAGIELHCYSIIELQQLDLQNQSTLSQNGKEFQAYLSVMSSDSSSCVKIYMKHNATQLGDDACATFHLQLAEALCDVFKEYNMDLGSVLQEVMKLRPRFTRRFTLGSTCQEFRVSHRPDIDFEEGELIAYRLPSADRKEHVFQAIFAKVVKEETLGELKSKEEGAEPKAIASGQELALVPTGGESFQTQTDLILDFQRVYEIQVNSDEEIMPVKVTDLYKIDKKQAVQVMEETEALQHVTDVLEEAWDLEDEDDHKRVINRLFLYWHPESNTSNGDYARRVSEHIRGEIKRLLREDEELRQNEAASSLSVGSSAVDHRSYQRAISMGYHSGIRLDKVSLHLNVRGSGPPSSVNQGAPSTRPIRLFSTPPERTSTAISSLPSLPHDNSGMMQRQVVRRRRRRRKLHKRCLCYSDYIEIFAQLEKSIIEPRGRNESRTVAVGGSESEFSSRGSCSNGSQSLVVIPNYDEARRWFRQASNDFHAARLCSDGRFYSNAASMCHQATEKALKAALFVVDGFQHRGHRLTDLARDVVARHSTFNEVVQVAHELSLLKCNNESTRYPDLWAIPDIPAVAYKKDDVDKMVILTEKVLTHVASLIHW
ncbi:PREDICTED: sacsin-like [Branchiostoma belcheri]|uniref:Sacsin-like n=1 Tax=Branchiostoma belcheri TaxID=7741 RepID=A0A6P4ZE11_BRABE|nr:PREDICTED: sacsin-like [Branchiostoma belcheri]